VGGNGDVRLPLISFPLTSATQDGKSHVQDGTTFGFYPLVGLDQLNMSFLFSPVNGAVGKTISSSSSSPSILREQDIKKKHSGRCGLEYISCLRTRYNTTMVLFCYMAAVAR
jgi:hypothetical protein